jgi:hypothetical protein
MRLACLLFAGAVCTAACGGSVAIIPGGGDDGGGADGSTNGDVGSGGDGSIGDASQPTCEQLHKNIDELRPAAQQCCPSCHHAPCQFTVQDLCCPMTVDAQSSSDVTAFENAVQAFKSAGCQAVCIVACVTPRQGCDPNTSECR